MSKAIKCPRCETKTWGDPGHLKHCASCGHSLFIACPTCGHSWRSVFEYRYCPSCGTQVNRLVATANTRVA